MSFEALEARQLLAVGPWVVEGEDCGSDACDVARPQVALVDVPTKPVSALGVTFDEPVNADALIGNGSIVDAVSIERLGQGPLALGSDRFIYHAGTRTLEVTFEEPLADGTYQLQLDDALLADLAGNPLRGGRYGAPSPQAPEMAAESFLMVGTSEIQVDNYSVPAIVDWNNDGRDDLIVGEKTDAGQGKVRIYLNQSDNVAVPDYQAFFYAPSEAADLVVSGSGCMGVAPRAFDWDRDGRKDLVLGLSDGRVQVALNVRTDEEPLFAAPTNVQVGPVGAKADIDVGNRATVDVVDWNGDGRNDLVLGNFDGQVLVLIDQADSGPPEFVETTIVTGNAGDLAVPGGRSSVAVGDLDGDGLDDLVIGNTNGELLFYANLGTASSPFFDQYEQIRTGEGVIDLDDFPRSRPFLADVNGDGAMDILVGAADGRVRLYAGLSPAEAESTGETPGESVTDESVTDGDYVYMFQIPALETDASWQCPHDRLDVNDDGFITPLDVLLLINRIQADGPGPLPDAVPTSPPYWDCSGNGDISPLDIMLVIRDINGNGPRTLDADEAGGGSCDVSAAGAPACTGEGEADEEWGEFFLFADWRR